jgi:hypothetical protein
VRFTITKNEWEKGCKIGGTCGRLVNGWMEGGKASHV